MGLLLHIYIYIYKFNCLLRNAGVVPSGNSLENVHSHKYAVTHSV